MTSADEKFQALERSIDRALRAQPDVRAPRSLESRVLKEIAQRAALPGWRGGFVHWPLAARVSFLLASPVVVKFALTGAMWVLDRLRAAPVADAVTEKMSWFHILRDAGSSLTTAFMYVLNSIPSFWLYAVALGGVAAYATFFGLGAAVYRTLYK